MWNRDRQVYVRSMSETAVAEQVRLNFPVIDARCAELGAKNEVQRAVLLIGTPTGRTTLWRWRNGRVDVGIGRARMVAATLGLELTDIILPEAAATPAPAPAARAGDTPARPVRCMLPGHACPGPFGYCDPCPDRPAPAVASHPANPSNPPPPKPRRPPTNPPQQPRPPASPGAPRPPAGPPRSDRDD